MSMSFDPVSYLMGQKSAGGGGGGSDILVVHVDDDTQTLDQTWQTIYDAIVVGRPACIIWHGGEGGSYYEADLYWITEVSYNGEEGYVVRDISPTYWIANSADGYPVGS